MKVIKRSYSESEKNLINELASNSRISPITAEILYGRGYDSVQKIEEFLNPGAWNKYSPFTLLGMAEAVERIIQAKDNDEMVVVYGDYDADGICATTVLYKALKKFGVNVYAVIPERDNGYGLSKEVIDEVVETLFPDLIITVDCGISAKAEVEYIHDLGVDVIVTDHHEIPEELPETIIVSTKTKNQEYPFEYLSGAGVAYKVASALIGDEADNYLDFVAISTIADSMPLIGENRNIVYRGVENIKIGRCSKAITDLLVASNSREITATSLAFTVAPRINAAGRMGSARTALELFLTEDESERQDLINKLVKFNVDRQVECENLYKSVKDLLKNKKIDNSIVLYDNNWNGGLLGIVAARLTEEYNVPTILFAGTDGVYHGSARSTQDINVYEAIASTSDICEDFGGHAQAAGVTILEENISLFEEKINLYLKENFSVIKAEKTIEVDYEIDGDYSLALAREINMLEPFGLGNKKPLFLYKSKNLTAKQMKENSPHITIKGNRLDLIYFNGIKCLEGINCNITKNVIFESSVSYYNQREYAKGLVKLIDFEIEVSEDLIYRSFKNALKSLLFKCKCNIQKITENELIGLIDGAKPNDRGTLFIVTNPENYIKFEGLKKFQAYPLKFSKCGGKNAVLIGCDLQELELYEYHTLVYVDMPICPYVENSNQKVIVSSVSGFGVSGISKDLGVLRDAFRFITSSENACLSAIEIAKLYGNYQQLLFAVEVFKELEFIEEKDVIFVNRGVKKDLTLSKIYNNLDLSPLD